MISVTTNTLLSATRCNYPLKEVRTSYVSFSGLRLTKYNTNISQYQHINHEHHTEGQI